MTAATRTTRRLLITPGDPAGIGGAIFMAAIKAGAHERHGAGLMTMDDPARLHALADSMGFALNAEAVEDVDAAAQLAPDCLAILPMQWNTPPVAGKPDASNAPQIIDTITRAAQMAKAGEVAAMVTNPIHKAGLTAAGFPDSGHTDYLGRLDNAPHKPVMMLCAEEGDLHLRVIPLTIHVPLADVPGLITKERIMEVARITHAALQKNFACAAPRIAVAGLNPHAGEDGNMGREEIDIIAPAIAELRELGMDITGPHPADTLFREAARKNYDAAIAMYHDQALIPIKTLAFETAVNVTLGLSFIRTSPDHGTAFDIAGSGKADARSLISAIALAADMARHA